MVSRRKGALGGDASDSRRRDRRSHISAQLHGLRRGRHWFAARAFPYDLAWRKEVVSGGTITTGNDPDAEPITESITMVGADPDEGVPYKAPAPEPREHGIPRHCLT